MRAQPPSELLAVGAIGFGLLVVAAWWGSPDGDTLATASFVVTLVAAVAFLTRLIERRGGR